MLINSKSVKPYYIPLFNDIKESLLYNVFLLILFFVLYTCHTNLYLSTLPKADPITLITLKHLKYETTIRDNFKVVTVDLQSSNSFHNSSPIHTFIQFYISSIIIYQ